MEYLDFEVAINEGRAGDYQVMVIRSPEGETRETTRFPFDNTELKTRLSALRSRLIRARGMRDVVASASTDGKLAEQAAREFGGVMYDLLFTGQVGELYRASLREARRKPGRGLRIKLRTFSPELVALPWELLHDDRGGDFLGLSKATPLVRYLESAQPSETLKVAPPLRILGLIASPAELPALDFGRERELMEAALDKSRERRLIDITWLSGGTWQALNEAMERGGGGPWHIFHFIGHGGFDPHTNEGQVVLAGNDGKRHDLNATRLSRLLRDHQTFRLAVLNSCEGATGSGFDVFSSTAATLVKGGLPAVVSMQYAISDPAAIEFGGEFYRSLAVGSPVDTAVAKARKVLSIALQNSVEWATPVLHMRSPDGQLFQLERTMEGPSTDDQIPTDPQAARLLHHNRGARTDFFYRSLTIGCRWVTPRRYISVRTCEIEALKDGLAALPFYLKPRRGRDVKASVEGENVSLEPGKPGHASEGAHTYLVTFQPTLKSGESARFKITLDVTILDDGHLEPRWTWTSEHHVDFLTLRVVFTDPIPEHCSFQSWDAELAIRQKKTLEIDPISNEVAYQIESPDLGLTYAICWENWEKP
jgi:hypothetical protein